MGGGGGGGDFWNDFYGFGLGLGQYQYLPSSSDFGITFIYLKGYDLLKFYDKRDDFDFDVVIFFLFYFIYFFFFGGGGGGGGTFLLLPLTELKLLNSFDIC